MSPASDRLQAGLVLLLATGAGLAVASLYYNQPMLGLLGAELRAGAAALGWVPTLTQLGYAAGILLLAPLGDRYDRKRIILAKAGALILALLLAAAAPSLGVLLAASFAIGLSATLAQDIVPAAAALAPAETRGRIVGTVMTGLLLGILLSRVVGGVVAEHYGWRVMFAGAAAAIALLALALWRGLPRFAPTSALPYRHLLASLGALWRRHPELRRAALAQGLLSLGFSAFWSTLAVMLHGAPFHLGAESAGAFGLAGAAGALAAPLAGRQADRRGPAAVGRLGAGLTALSFAAMLALPWLPGTAGLWLIALATLGFDLGIQMALIAHQSMVYSIEPAARSRLNAVLMVSVFIGMAAGGALGSIMLARWGWTGVTLLATAAALGALALRLAAPARAYAA
ncbi:MFS transporter [Bordetella hinzii]|uniref:MFS transporter n=3 Tax=Bordetella hinzii TaxID=103855 RepID=A0AAN1RX35_9BORD|nr:MFS transporter [Bordetella hinzii]AKQ61365.1 Inner membrane transport protein YnfM [Bordetella hinzii]AZW17657.1 MFS transporter [Bordetella hinzii]KCB23925.1 transporter, major facilitator family protein [Bordetella hinzii OH87 BAL007II]KCB43175.1 transporter, major facilitator family protein [Bordetella hinzii 5132]MBZ0077183.1 MFS transporter [Bordetella hinzii]